MDNLSKKVSMMTGTEFLKAVEAGKLDPFPKYQRMAAPSAALVDSLETDARIGFLCFMFPVRKKEIGDGLRRIQVLQSWAADEEKAVWLDSVHIVLSNYDHLSQADFVELYVRMNGNAKKHTPGDFCKAYQHLLDDEVQKFLNRSEFLEDGDWFPYTKANSHWMHAVVVQHGLHWSANRETILNGLTKTEGEDQHIKRTVRSASETTLHLERVYKLLTAMRKLHAKSTTSKWAVSLISDALDRFPNLLNVTVDVMLHAWEQYLDNTAGKPRSDAADSKPFLDLIPQVMQQMSKTVGTV